MRSETPIYRSIAVDVARRIVNDHFGEGAKISGRTLLASHYNTSPETIRKAISLLKDEEVVDVSQGKEVVVLSKDKAYNFIEHYQSVESVYSLRQDLEILLQQKQELDERLEGILHDIIAYSDRLRNLTPYNPVEIEVAVNSHVVGKTVGKVKFWQHTGATIVAIRRGTEIIVSPGPSAVIEPRDRMVVVGSPDSLRYTAAYLQRPKQ
ncbi:TrkA C-terminal domain-containing protein [Anaeroselena agilis]|uniref:TrkA C-terminal domain-containing protein n=1 Tax=Anaeroselena agilis TaxID=3063788 RepID=A0ABU3P1G1_9FIRM|nr:TrkA C-terminal domain-containing protein [Selenomonadales bacterium 4137-cl]